MEILSSYPITSYIILFVSYCIQILKTPGKERYLNVKNHRNKTSGPRDISRTEEITAYTLDETNHKG